MTAPKLVFWPGLTGTLVLGCSKAPDKIGAAVLSQGLKACTNDGVDGKAHDRQRCVTYRAIAGVSMGGGASTRIAFQHPELFDTAVSLGSPYIDLEHFFLSIGKYANGGFCPKDQ